MMHWKPLLVLAAACAIGTPVVAQTQASGTFTDFEGDTSGWVFNNSPLGNGGWAVDGTPAQVVTVTATGSSAFSGSKLLNYNNGTSYDFRGSLDSPYNTNRGIAWAPSVSTAAMADPVLRFWCNYETETLDGRFDRRWVIVGAGKHSIVGRYGMLEAGKAGMCGAMGRWHIH